MYDSTTRIVGSTGGSGGGGAGGAGGSGGGAKKEGGGVEPSRANIKVEESLLIEDLKDDDLEKPYVSLKYDPKYDSTGLEDSDVMETDAVSRENATLANILNPQDPEESKLREKKLENSLFGTLNIWFQEPWGIF